MAHLITPPPPKDKVKSLGRYLSMIGEWQNDQEPSGGDTGFLSQLWYRGVKQQFPNQAPGVYRKEFTTRAEALKKDGSTEAKRLHLERELLGQFRTAGAAFLTRSTPVDIYFAAQHFGMPTRLLDWSTNPLNALFFACEDAGAEDGVVYAMDARKVIPSDAKRTKTDKLYQAVMTMRHPFVEYAVGLSFWNEPKPEYNAYVLPVRPDIVPGRIGQQGSCFTLHMHEAPPASNDTMVSILIDAGTKETIRRELHRLNVNQFTTYYDLDHLSKEIRRSWGIDK